MSQAQKSRVVAVCGIGGAIVFCALNVVTNGSVPGGAVGGAIGGICGSILGAMILAIIAAISRPKGQ